MDENIILRKLTTQDLGRVAAVHAESFPDSALTRLGTGVIEHYYRWQLTGPHRKVHAVGAFKGESCAGFLFGGDFSAGSLSGFLRINKNLLIKHVLLHPQNLFEPFFFSRLLTGIRILRRSRNRAIGYDLPESANPHKKCHSFGIVAIAVAKDFQSLGIGRLLMEDAEREACQSGFSRMDLSVHPDNFRGIRFYEKLGWEKFPSGEMWRGVMIKQTAVPAKAEFLKSMQSHFNI
jgi:ribosomal protein S18 acetylase RimI-like enzyme